MSNAVLIIGKSGTGKSTSLRNLNPKETYIINVLDKPLPFRGYKAVYRKGETGKPGNYLATDNCILVKKCIQEVNANRPEIKNIVIDDWQYLMCNEFMRRSTEAGWDKFTQIGKSAWETLELISKLRSDLNVFVLAHSERDDAGQMKVKTIGKMIEEKVTVEGMFTVVLHTIVRDGKYKFLTQYDGTHLAKSPLDMFEDQLIENDLKFVSEQIKSYYNVPEINEQEAA